MQQTHTVRDITKTCLLLVVRRLDDGRAADASSAARGDEANLLAGRCVAAHRGRVADVLVVAATVGVLHGVHGHTTHLHTQIINDFCMICICMICTIFV